MNLLLMAVLKLESVGGKRQAGRHLVRGHLILETRQYHPADRKHHDKK